MNGLIADGKAYEAIAGKSCQDCDFDKAMLVCRMCRDICDEWQCAFRFSQELTDKINRE